ncbi:hypothetical protein [Thermoproteus tenax]|uniref:Uncharacterized protein n=1 Tax=Thermoproteus tenax (strain ATCC 35583 / DSM 2078 / JCM 9277 / NBRC 100435 / Kra 1) TaxID=768679 RepID=G4RN16_THETK|nr:hypothetical protein [Thermoproteus tenax]CCC80960.1 hypothetical protein TTX_0284 [Thermoproteus tenax Kra 1]
MGGGAPRGGASTDVRLALALALVAAALYLYYAAPLYPHITVVVEGPGGSPQPGAFVQVYALLPPGVNRSLVLIWNGTTDGEGRAYVPLDRLAPIARKWAEKGFGGAHVGLEVIATYSSSTALLTRFLFVTYTPGRVIGANNPLGLLYYSKTVVVRLEQVRINDSAGSRGFSALQPTPPTPSPSLCAHSGVPVWEEVWDYQTPTMYIPIIWLYDRMGYKAGGNIMGLFSPSTTTDFAAGLALTPSTELSSSDIGEAEFEFAGTSFSSTTSAFNYAYWGLDTSTYYPTSVALYVQGTLGTAEFQLYCYIPSDPYGQWVPVDYYAVEVYIQSADLSKIYSSGSVGTAPVNNMVNILSQYGYLGYYPLDYYQRSSNGFYGYGFINWGFSWSIPAGALLWSALQEAGAAPPPYSEAIAAALVVVASFSSTTTIPQAVSFTVGSSLPPYGDVLVSYLAIPYQNGGDLQPFMAGVIIEPSTSYTVNTTLAISGPNVVPIQCGLYNVTFYVYPYIGSSPLLVPGGSVNYQIYDDVTGQLVASGSVGVPWHKPAVIRVVLYPGTYTLVVQYAGYNDGPITYRPSTSQIQTTIGEEC